jgi:hypothetical protein
VVEHHSVRKDVPWESGRVREVQTRLSMVCRLQTSFNRHCPSHCWASQQWHPAEFHLSTNPAARLRHAPKYPNHIQSKSNERYRQDEQVNEQIVDHRPNPARLLPRLFPSLKLFTRRQITNRAEFIYLFHARHSNAASSQRLIRNGRGGDPAKRFMQDGESGLRSIGSSQRS